LEVTAVAAKAAMGATAMSRRPHCRGVPRQCGTTLTALFPVAQNGASARRRRGTDGDCAHWACGLAGNGGVSPWPDRQPSAA